MKGALITIEQYQVIVTRIEEARTINKDYMDRKSEYFKGKMDGFTEVIQILQQLTTNDWN